MKKIVTIILFFVLISSLWANYNFDKAFWNCWPRNAGKVKSLRVNGQRQVSFDFKQTTSPISLYTRGKGDANQLYKVNLVLNCQNLEHASNATAKLKINFQNNNKKQTALSVISNNISLKNHKNLITSSFVMPKDAVTYQVSLVLTGTSGTVNVVQCEVVKLVTTLKIPKIKNKNSLWKNTKEIFGFFRYGSSVIANCDSKVLLNYDKENIYLKVICQEDELSKLKASVTKFDGPVYLDDSIELFLASKNRCFQFVLNSKGVAFDGELKVTVPGNPRTLDKMWNGSWKRKAYKIKDAWIGEFVIPFNRIDFDVLTQNILRINILRNRRGAALEQTQLDRRFGMPSNDAHFSKIVFTQNDATFIRSMMEMDKDALAVNRENKEFEKVPRKDGNYIVVGPGCDVYLGRYSSAFRKKNKAIWPKKTMEIVDAMQKSNMLVPAFYPWVITHLGGRKTYSQVMQKYPNLKFGYAVHNTSYDRSIINKGTPFFHGRFSNVADSNLRNITAVNLDKFLSSNPEELKKILFARGFDEPTNSLKPCFSYSLNPNNLKNLKKLDEYILKNYGYGKYGMPDVNRGMQENDDSLRHIAFSRWWNNEAHKTFATLQKILQAKAPQIPFMPLVCNTVDAYSGYEELPLLASTGNWIGVDPYPTSTRSNFSVQRALYHTGFATKLAKDLSDNAKIFVYIQAFRYHGQVPNKENLYEWVSQALKNGADILSFYALKNLEECPEVYKNVLEVSKIVTTMKPLVQLKNSPVAILYNYVGNWGRFDRGQMDYYSLYSLFGEYIQGDFSFIGDRQIKEKVPSYIKLCFAPSLEFVDKEVAASLENFVKNGGTLVTFDPLSFRVAPNGTNLAQRKTLLGNPALTPIKEAKEIILVKNKKKLQLFADNNIKCYAVKVPENADIIAEFPNGKVAVYSKTVGKGKIICFAVNPFNNANVVTNPGYWTEFFKECFKQVNAKTGMNIWNFTIPVK